MEWHEIEFILSLPPITHIMKHKQRYTFNKIYPVDDHYEYLPFPFPNYRLEANSGHRASGGDRNGLLENSIFWGRR